MKKCFFLFLCIPFITYAQDKPLIAEGVSPSLYITHKVAPKENYYSIGRIYNISPRDIAPFNNLQLENGLSVGQTIRVPLNSSNFFQSGTAAPDETFVPVMK
jgi:LysM repeat protein